MSALFDFQSLLVVILLFLCSTTYIRSMRPTIFFNKNDQPNQHTGLLGFCWKCSRIGERLSPYVSAACILSAIYILFIKA